MDQELLPCQGNLSKGWFTCCHCYPKVTSVETLTCMISFSPKENRGKQIGKERLLLPHRWA